MSSLARGTIARCTPPPPWLVPVLCLSPQPPTRCHQPPPPRAAPALRRSPDQLVLRNHIDALALLHPRFKALIVTDEAAPGWNGPTGPLTKPLLAAVLPPPTEGDSTVILVAGDVAAAAGKPTKARASGVLGVMQYAPAQVRAL